MSVKVVLAVIEMQLDEGLPMINVGEQPFSGVALENEAGFVQVASSNGNYFAHLERTPVSGK
jgi:hypothetical protein